MRTAVKLPVLAIVAILLLPVSKAAAIEVDPAGSITTVGELVVLSEGGWINPEVTCSVTLNGTLARSIVDSSGSHFGTMSGMRSSSCSGGSLTLGNTWPIFYNSKNLATEPKPFNVTLGGVWMRTISAGTLCGALGSLLAVIPATGSPLVALVITLRSDLLFTDIEGSIFCPPFMGLAGGMTLTRQTLTLP